MLPGLMSSTMIRTTAGGAGGSCANAGNASDTTAASAATTLARRILLISLIVIGSGVHGNVWFRTPLGPRPGLRLSIGWRPKQWATRYSTVPCASIAAAGRACAVRRLGSTERSRQGLAQLGARRGCEPGSLEECLAGAERRQRLERVARRGRRVLAHHAEQQLDRLVAPK